MNFDNGPGWNSSLGQDRESLMRAVDLILWIGCFVFFAFVVSIWLWLGSSDKSKVSDYEPCSLDTIDEDNERGGKSPIRHYSTHIQRTTSRTRFLDSP